ncbi:MAG: amidophosphoribosyltransferase [Candidatus Egerieousia sp.]
MSEQIKHECGVVLLRLLKPLDYYKQKYGTRLYGLNKLYLMMEKQHNRGQEGAGLACVNIEAKPGNEYIFRERALGNGAISECFANINKAIDNAKATDTPEDEYPYSGEVYLGHLRYSTTGRSGMSYVHPFLRRNNWRSRNLCLAGNFNLTNDKELMESMVTEQGQHPRSDADTFLILEQLGALLDDKNSELYRKFKKEGYTGEELNRQIENNFDMESVITEASKSWDGGFCITGITGSGESFILRDRWGIRPCFYYIDDEVFVAASERAAIQTAMNVKYEDVKELYAGQAVLISKNGTMRVRNIIEPNNPRPCSFERIYFSRGSDADIYKERKMLGKLLLPQILEKVENIDDTVFSYIPNTAEVAYYGLMEGMTEHYNKLKFDRITRLPNLEGENRAKLAEILSHNVRSEKIAIKDIKMRTFIAEGSSRKDMAAHVYDITYKSIRPHKDSIAIIDDSIVRGTTLKESIIKILSRLEPKEIIILSSSPQIRYPDCYGIDMSRMNEFIAFNAAIALIKERGMEHILKEVYDKCKATVGKPLKDYVSTGIVGKGEKAPYIENYVKEIYSPFTDEEICDKIAELVTPDDVKCKVKIIFLSIENLHKACPKNNGDWYFSGDYPTPGGTRTAIRSYINYYESMIKNK